MRSRVLGIVVVLMLTVGVAAPASGEEHQDWTVEVVATGLDNPRGVTIGRGDVVYVAESGSGGPTLVDARFGGQPGPGCLGDTGGITRVDRRGNVRRIATLPSFAPAFDPDGPGAVEPNCDGPIGFASVGPSNVDVGGRGGLVVLMGLGGDLALQGNVGGEFGTLLRVRGNTSTIPIADLVAYEEANDPAGDGSDSNPYGVASRGSRRYVADAGGNTLLEVRANGAISTLAVFPPLDPVPFTPPSCFGDLPPEVQAQFPPEGTPIPPQSVPTAVAVGPGKDLFVGILTGFPFGVGVAKVYRVDAATGDVSVYADGLTHVTGIDFDRRGNLYVAQITDGSLLEGEVCGTPEPGSVIKIDRHGNREVLAQFPAVGDVAVSHRTGDVYVTYDSIVPAFAGGGSLAKLSHR